MALRTGRLKTPKKSKLTSKSSVQSRKAKKTKNSSAKKKVKKISVRKAASKKNKKTSSKKLSSKSVKSKTTKKSNKPNLGLSTQMLLRIHDLMVKSRKLEERLIQIYKRGEAYFWIGGPGEEAFGVALGLQIMKGEGPRFDYSHLHYRCTPTLIAMGMDIKHAIRLIMNKGSDTSTGGRNFSNHYCFPKWNVVPVTSPIEVQYNMAIGTAIAQKRAGGNGVSIVTGGDAGSAEGDFASSLIWASRPANPLPMYLTVQNNKWGISTDFDSQHGEKSVADRGKPFGIRTGTYNGNDPIESYLAIEEDLKYIRKYKKPVVSEFVLSRLYGHSSASGANLENEPDCLELFEKKLCKNKVLTKSEINKIHLKYEAECKAASDEIALEPEPESKDLWKYFFAQQETGNWRDF